MDKPSMSGWSAEQVKAYDAAMSALQAEEQQAAEQATKRKAEAESPETLIALAQEKAAAVKRERERAAQEAADDRAYARAVKEQGGAHRVGRIDTHEGTIILIPMTGTAYEDFADRISHLTEDHDLTRVSQETIWKTLYHPARDRFDELVSRFPGVWPRLFNARNALIDGVKEEQRKNV